MFHNILKIVIMGFDREIEPPIPVDSGVPDALALIVFLRVERGVSDVV